MLVSKYYGFLKGHDGLVFDFFVIVDPLLSFEGRLCGYQRAVVAVYLAVGDALPPNISIDIGEFNDEVFEYGGNAGVSLR